MGKYLFTSNFFEPSILHEDLPVENLYEELEFLPEDKIEIPGVNPIESFTEPLEVVEPEQEVEETEPEHETEQPTEPIEEVMEEDTPKFSKGGKVKGKSHKNGGVKGINKTTGEPIEVEGGEVIITKKAVKDKRRRTLHGTNKEILDKVNRSGGGVPIMEKGGIVRQKAYDKEYNKMYTRISDENLSVKEFNKKHDAWIMQNAPKYGFKKEDYMKMGGKIKSCSYKGKTAQQIWDEWTPKQRAHFIKDHKINSATGSIAIPLKYRLKAAYKSYDKLHPELQRILKEHIEDGQYKKGGKVKKTYKHKPKKHGTRKEKTHKRKKARGRPRKKRT